MKPKYDPIFTIIKNLELWSAEICTYCFIGVLQIDTIGELSFQQINLSRNETPLANVSSSLKRIAAGNLGQYSGST